MQIVETRYSSELDLLGYLFDTGAKLFWGAGVLPGTDVPTYRFVHSSGFKRSEEYKEGKLAAVKYSHRLGYSGPQEYFESFTENKKEIK